jgi:hypothetical protein
MRASSWLEVDVRRLRKMIEAGVPAPAIALELGRSISAIKNKALMQGYRRVQSMIETGEISIASDIVRRA